MAFNPDKYLAEKKAFNPDKYLAEKKASNPEEKPWYSFGGNTLADQAGRFMSKPLSTAANVISKAVKGERLPDLLPSEEMRTAASLALMAVPAVGLAARAGISAGIGGISGISAAANKLAKGAGIKAAVKTGVNTAVKTGVTDFALGGVVTLAGKGLGKLGKGVVESKLARQTIEVIKEGAEDLSHNVKTSIMKLQNKAAKLKENAEKGILLKSLENTADVKAKIINTEKAVTATQQTIDNRLVNIVKPITKSMENVQNSLSKEYDNVLRQIPGQEKYVNVNNEINTLVKELGIIQTPGQNIKTKLENIVKAIQNNVPSKKLPIGIKKRIDRTPDGGALDARDAHWLKMALNEWSYKIPDTGTNYAFKGALRETASQISKRLDETLGGKYKTLTSKYNEYLQVKDDTDKLFGEITKLPDRGTVRKKALDLGNELKEIVKSGRPLDSDFVKLSYNKVNNIYEQASQLRKNGAGSAADQLENKMKSIADAQFKKGALEKDLEDLSKTLSSTPAVAQLLRLQTKTERESIANQIRSMRLERENELRAMSLEQRELAKKIIQRDDAEGIARSMISDGFASLAGLSGVPASALRALGSISTMKRYGMIAADKANKALDAIEKSMLLRTTSRTIRTSISNLVGTIRYDSSEQLPTDAMPEGTTF
jgi:hypothetical protein